MVTLLPAALDAQLQRERGGRPGQRLALAPLAGRRSAPGPGGLITREACPDDGPATSAVLTDAGYAKETVRQLVFDALTRGSARSCAIGEQVLGRVNPGGSCPA